jgi:hypothetical protein
MMFLECPSRLDQENAARRGLPAEATGTGSLAGRDRLRGGHDGVPERIARRPNSAPAYYLGRPARLWIPLMRPNRRSGAAARKFGAPGPDLADVFFPVYYLAARHLPCPSGSAGPRQLG